MTENKTVNKKGALILFNPLNVNKLKDHIGTLEKKL